MVWARFIVGSGSGKRVRWGYEWVKVESVADLDRGRPVRLERV